MASYALRVTDEPRFEIHFVSGEVEIARSLEDARFRAREIPKIDGTPHRLPAEIWEMTGQPLSGVGHKVETVH